MVKPSLQVLMEKENVNRYALVVATAQCARQITDDYTNQRQYLEKHTPTKGDSNKNTVQEEPLSRPLDKIVNEKYRDEKAVKNAIDELYNGEYRIIRSTLPEGMGRDEEPAPAEEEATETEAAVEESAEAEAAESEESENN